jgi:uncharacterized protein
MSKQRTVYIVHGCPSKIEKSMNPETRTYDKHWMPWLKKELIKKEVRVETPLMPNPWVPDYNSYKAKFEEYEIGENDILVGHSCGSAFLVRWLGDTKKKIHKLILVAPWTVIEDNDKLRKHLYIYDIDESTKERVDEIVIFTSNNEEEGGKESARIFNKALGGKVIELKNRGHYTIGDMGTEEFPELLENIL